MQIENRSCFVSSNSQLNGLRAMEREAHLTYRVHFFPRKTSVQNSRPANLHTVTRWPCESGPHIRTLRDSKITKSGRRKRAGRERVRRVPSFNKQPTVFAKTRGGLSSQPETEIVKSFVSM